MRCPSKDKFNNVFKKEIFNKVAIVGARRNKKSAIPKIPKITLNIHNKP